MSRGGRLLVCGGSRVVEVLGSGSCRGWGSRIGGCGDLKVDRL